MYCRRGLSSLFMESKRSCIRFGQKKLLKTAIHGIESPSPLTTLSCNLNFGVISDKNVRCQKLQGSAASSYLKHRRNFQTTVMHFPRRCKNTEGASEVSSSDDCEKPVSFNDVASRLLKCSSVQEQMEELCRILCLTPEHVKRRKEFSLRIKEMLSPFFNNSRVQIFGSSANGFGFIGCDIDLSVNIIGDNRRQGPTNFSDPDVPTVHDFLEGKISLDYLAKLSQKDQLLFIHSVFLKYYTDTTEPILFCNAYVPIIRFSYDRSSLKCDLSFGNSVAFRNTKLLKLYKLLDKRVTPIMMTIRYWAKHRGLIAGGPTFNSYTMSLLVIYFLQTRTPPVLPSAEYLISISEYLNNDDMEDESYLQISETVPPSENKQTIVELLKEFFFYYTYFDYTQVMCPLIGSSLSRIKVHSLKRNFRMNTIAIQDPLKPSHNVSNLVDYACYKKFFTELLLAMRLFHEGKLLSPSSSNWGILALLEKPKNFTATLPEGDPLLTLQIPYFFVSTENVESKCSNYSDKAEKQEWFQKVSQIVLDILEYGLLFECKVKEDSVRSKESLSDEHQPTVEDGETLIVNNHNHCELGTDSSEVKDILYHKKPSFVINCTAYHNTWSGRDDVKKKICSHESFSNFLEVEHSVSLELNNQRKIDEKRELISFACECYKMDNEKDACLYIKLKPFQRTDFNPILGLFLRDYLPKTVVRILSSTKTEPLKQMDVLNNV